MVKIVCIGDSITAGQHLEEGYSPWPHLIDVKNATVYAKGIPGETTRMGLERFPRDVQQIEPDVVVIQFGHNDANRWETDRGLPRVSLQAYIANLNEMIDRCQQFGARPYLCTLTPTYRSEQHAADCEMYNDWLCDVARKRGVRLLDVRPVIEEAHLLDGLHLNFDGHLRYAGVVGAGL